MRSFKFYFQTSRHWKKFYVKNIPEQICSGNIAQKMKSSLEDFFSKYDQIRSFLRIWSHLLKKYLMENFIFCAVIHTFHTSQLQLTRLRFASFFLLSVYLIYHLKMLLRSYSATVIKYYYVYVTCTPTENFFKFRWNQ